MAEVTQAPTTQPPPTTVSTPNKSNGSAAPVVVQEIPLDRIVESKTNPRRSWDEKADGELADSIRQHGVLQAVLVRPWTGQHPYQLVAGARRFRAAKTAGLKTIPAAVRVLTDQQALELQIIENLQREDVKPIEEGQGYRALLAEMAKRDPKRAADGQGARRQDLVEQIAKKVGKSVRYVYARMKLTELIPEIQSALAKGELAASHADLLVRIPASQQKKALALCYQDEWHGGKCAALPVSVRQLATELERRFNLNLDTAPWKKDDATLVPKAGACSACPHNSSNDPLRPESAPKNRCVNPECYEAKEVAFVKVQMSAVKKSTGKTPALALNQWGYSANDEKKVATAFGVKPQDFLHRHDVERHTVAKGSCDSTQPVVVASGESVGQVIHVCGNVRCKKHHAASPGTSSHRFKPNPKEAAAAKAKEEQSRVAQEAVFKAALGKVKSLGTAELDLLVDAFGNFTDSEAAEKLLAAHFGWEHPDTAPYNWLAQQWKKVGARLTAEQKAQFLVGLVIGEFVSPYAADQLNKAAAHLKVDVKAVRARAIQDMKKQQAAAVKAKAQTSAQPAKKAVAKKKGGR